MTSIGEGTRAELNGDKHAHIAVNGEGARAEFKGDNLQTPFWDSMVSSTSVGRYISEINLN